METDRGVDRLAADGEAGVVAQEIDPAIPQALPGVLERPQRHVGADPRLEVALGVQGLGIGDRPAACVEDGPPRRRQVATDSQLTLLQVVPGHGPAVHELLFVEVLPVSVLFPPDLVVEALDVQGLLAQQLVGDRDLGDVPGDHGQLDQEERDPVLVAIDELPARGDEARGDGALHGGAAEVPQGPGCDLLVQALQVLGGQDPEGLLRDGTLQNLVETIMHVQHS